MFTKILCPLDLSAFSTHAFEHALAIGQWYGADVVAMHVFSASMPPGDLSTYPGWMMQIPEAKKQIEGQLQELLAPARARGIEVPLVTREGNPVAEILSQASEMGADLIVLSTHGRSGFDRFALGSVTEKVLRKAVSPVLVVPAREEEPPAPFTAYSHVVCAVDFSECSKRAMELAASLAAQSRALLTLAHVIEARDEAAPKGSAIAMLRETQLQGAREELRAAADTVRPHAGAGGLEQVIVFGTPHDELLRFADEKAASVIVMGVRGRNAVDLTIFGSTTNQLVRRARCPVMTVRS